MKKQVRSYSSTPQFRLSELNAVNDAGMDQLVKEDISNAVKLFCFGVKLGGEASQVGIENSW